MIFYYVYSNLKQKYRRSLLGFLWSLIAPLVHNLIVAVVFYHLMRFNMPNYLVYLFSGVLIYNLLSTIIMQSPFMMISNEGYIKKIYVPKLVFIVEMVLLETVNFILILVSLFILGIAFRKLSISLSFLYLPLPIVLSVLFVTGIAIVISIMSVYFRDMIHILPVVMQAAFFMTPVLYPLSAIPEKMQRIIYLNPLYYFVDIFRTPILYHHFPGGLHLLICSSLAILTFAFGLMILQKYNNRIVFQL